MVTQYPKETKKAKSDHFVPDFFEIAKIRPTELPFGILITRQRSKKVGKFEHGVYQEKNLKICGKIRKRM